MNKTFINPWWFASVISAIPLTFLAIGLVIVELNSGSAYLKAGVEAGKFLTPIIMATGVWVALKGINNWKLSLIYSEILKREEEFLQLVKEIPDLYSQFSIKSESLLNLIEMEDRVLDEKRRDFIKESRDEAVSRIEKTRNKVLEGSKLLELHPAYNMEKYYSKSIKSLRKEITKSWQITNQLEKLALSEQCTKRNVQLKFLKFSYRPNDICMDGVTQKRINDLVDEILATARSRWH